MDNRQLPLALFMVLVVAAVPAQAGAALPPSSIDRVVAGGASAEDVDDGTLAGMTGRYLGNDMLVGLRVELVSTWQAADGRQGIATGTLQIQRGDHGGFQIAIDSGSSANGGGAGGGAHAAASGAEQVQVRGIGQVVQIAGDGNRMGNVATISVRPWSASDTNANGTSASRTQSGDVTAQVTFSGGGIQLGVDGPGAHVGQGFNPGQGLQQTVRVAGDGQSGGNAMQLQLLTRTLPLSSAQMMGIRQALAGLQALPR